MGQTMSKSRNRNRKMRSSRIAHGHGTNEEESIVPLEYGTVVSIVESRLRAQASAQTRNTPISTAFPRDSNLPQHQDSSPATIINVASPLIRDSPRPDRFDRSALAQIIGVAKSEWGSRIDYTWAEHYDRLHNFLYNDLLDKLNQQLSSGLHPRQLLRNLDPASEHFGLRPYIWFAKLGMQNRVDWMRCREHLKMMHKLIDKDPMMELEALERLMREIEARMVHRQRAVQNRR